jgi:hypothetical protein
MARRDEDKPDEGPKPPEQLEGYGAAEPTGGSADNPPVYPDDYELVKPGEEEKTRREARKSDRAERRAHRDEEE